MDDIKRYLKKLRSDAEDCLTISETAASDSKREVFETLAATYQRLADEVEKIIAMNVVADGEREKRLMGLLAVDGEVPLKEFNNLFEQRSTVPTPDVRPKRRDRTLEE
jgi:hypothetical protein